MMIFGFINGVPVRLKKRSFEAPRYQGSVFGGFLKATWPVFPANEKTVHPVKVSLSR